MSSEQQQVLTEPCHHCALWRLCKSRRLACYTFAQYVSSGKELTRPENDTPTHDMFRHIFVEKRPLPRVKKLPQNKRKSQRTNPDDVRMILKCYDAGINVRELAEKFDRDSSTVANIVKGRSWKHIHDEHYNQETK